MTDDLAKYEALANHYRLADNGMAADAITELVAMVRETRGLLYGTKGEVSVKGALEELAQFQKDWIAATKRAEAAERELAELKRRMRKPDEKLLELLRDGIEYNDPVWDTAWSCMRRGWLEAVNYLLEGE